VGGIAGRRFGVALAVIVVSALIGTTACGGSSSEKSERKVDGADGADKEAVKKFLDRLDEAVREGNTEFRVARLHPEVLDRYGEQQCRDFLAGPEAGPDPSRKDKVLRVDKPEAFDFTTDDGAIPVANAQLVLVKETFKKKTTERELHVASVNGQLHYFIDCGAPLQRQ
jgi:hypothetical protein